jgi:hypothetical protein
MLNQAPKRRTDTDDNRWWYEDGEALRGDWNSVGGDIRKSMKRMKREIEGCQERSRHENSSGHSRSNQKKSKARSNAGKSYP